MHESGIIDSIIDAVEKEAQNKNLINVKEFELEIGSFCGYSPAVIKAHFDHFQQVHLQENSKLKDAKIKFKVVPGKLLCTECGKNTTSEHKVIQCPHCGGILSVRSGEEIAILSVK